ncbi:MAG: PaaI family thioesterase [Williamsia herbipolensis]|nr:PaaI family thioesterase [Williamsia herbipolensis]
MRFEDIDDAEVDRRRQLVEPLTDAVRDLIDAVIRSEVDESEIPAITKSVREAATRLRRRQREGAYGVGYNRSMTGMPWGNPAVGVRNAIAPPMRSRLTDDGSRCADVHLGAAYEGPPGLVHGGICALLLDHLLGESAGDDGTPSFTAGIELRFVRETRLGAVHLRARTDRVDGPKKFVTGTISDATGVCVEATGLFIIPRWARPTVPTTS